jgi:hypothetical protein
MYCTSNRTYVEAFKNIWEPLILGFQMQVHTSTRRSNTVEDSDVLLQFMQFCVKEMEQ